MGASMSTMYYYPVSSSRAAKILMKVLRLHPCASVFISGLRILVRGGRAALWGRLQHKRRGPSLGSETHAVGLGKMVAQASACEPAQNQQLRPCVSGEPAEGFSPPLGVTVAAALAILVLAPGVQAQGRGGGRGGGNAA